MAELQIEPPEESEQSSLGETIVLRFGIMFLCAFFGFFLVLLGYLIALSFELDLEGFNNYPSTYFVISLLVWILAGLLTPYRHIQHFFEAFKGVTVVRVIGFVLFCGIGVVLYWYLLYFLTVTAVSIFGAE